MGIRKAFFKRAGRSILNFGRYRLLDGIEMQVLDILDGAVRDVKTVEPERLINAMRDRIQRKFTELRDGRPNQMRSYFK